MKIFFTYLSFFFAFVVVGHVKAQQAIEADSIYGLNPQLYNGRIYKDYYGNSVKGHQFLVSEEYKNGTLQVNGQVFEGLSLNYDVYGQKLLFSFENQTKATKIIIIPLDNIQSFIFDNKYYEVIWWQNQEYKIFQTIISTQSKIIIYVKKELVTTTSTSEYDYQFSDVKKQFWLLKDGEYYSFRNNRSFTKLFDKDKNKIIKKWIKQHQIKIHKASDSQINELLNFCDVL